ncbi:chloride channel protein [Luteolibacter ambystomatis]|uniref:Chloride channel protein n=1 Tax=Luteolibacter ambystomatis TaxID=2824561 RepID=A0A975IZY9_9BACT|nr:chloride channel protein [Luteolibacter ambystomatis]QUE50865.1 chloride channel protein [Luteolibacter ambystomatis]
MIPSLWSRARVPLLSVLLGGIVTLTAVGLIALIRLCTNLAFHGVFSTAESKPDFSTWGAWGIAVPVIGGLIIGVMARWGSPAIRGHGIPEAMQAIGTADSRIPARVAIFKPLSAAVSIGTGGPFGAEGPIIATGGAIGSLLGQWLPSSPVQRKILLAAGAAAGMTAIFGTPLAAVLLAIELLLFEYRGRSFLPVALATGTAMALRSFFHEPLPMFPLAFNQTPDLPLSFGSFVIGGVCGLLAVGITKAVYALEDEFEKLPIHWMWWPAIGGVVVGAIGWMEPRTLGVGYDNLRELLDGQMALKAIATLAVLKFISWLVALGSGTSGGTLAPLMTIGGAFGALAAHALHGVPGFEAFPVGLGVMIGMAATFAGASRAFLASVAFAFEATHAVGAFGPLLLGCGAAVLVSRVLMRETIMTEKLARRGVRIPSDYEPDFLHALQVDAVMEREPLTAAPQHTVAEIAARLGTHGSPWHDVRLIPITATDGTLLGIITRADLFAALEIAPHSTILEAGVTRPVTIHPEEPLSDAADRMIRNGIGRLPVVDRAETPKLVGLVTRRAILEARRHAQAQES